MSKQEQGLELTAPVSVETGQQGLELAAPVSVETGHLGKDGQVRQIQPDGTGEWVDPVNRPRTVGTYRIKKVEREGEETLYTPQECITEPLFELDNTWLDIGFPDPDIGRAQQRIREKMEERKPETVTYLDVEGEPLEDSDSVSVGKGLELP